MRRRPITLPFSFVLLAVVAGCVAIAQPSGSNPAVGSLHKWTKGKGGGWVWGKDDEVGALNEMTDASRLAALRMASSGKVYDLGVTYDRTSYKWPGHSPGEIISFRTPEGVKRQKDIEGVVTDVHRGEGKGDLFLTCDVVFGDSGDVRRNVPRAEVPPYGSSLVLELLVPRSELSAPTTVAEYVVEGALVIFVSDNEQVVKTFKHFLIATLS